MWNDRLARKWEERKRRNSKGKVETVFEGRLVYLDLSAILFNIKCSGPRNIGRSMDVSMHGHASDD